MRTTDTTDLILATTGVRVVLAKAWRILLTRELSEDILDGLFELSLFIRRDGTGGQKIVDWLLEEYIEGAGGTWDHLASLIVHHIKRTYGADEIFLSAAVLLSIMAASAHRDFSAIIFSHGITKVVAHALSLVAIAEAKDGTLKLQADCLTLLARVTSTSLGFARLGNSLSRGLLRVIVLCSKNLSSEPDILVLKIWLATILPSLTVIHSKLGHLHAALQAVRGMAELDEIAAPEVRELWNVFTALADQRMELKAHFDAPEYVTARACDNIPVSFRALRLSTTEEYFCSVLKFRTSATSDVAQPALARIIVPQNASVPTGETVVIARRVRT